MLTSGHGTGWPRAYRLDVLQRGGTGGEGIAGIGVMHGSEGGGMRRRDCDADPDASWLFLVFLQKGQRLVMLKGQRPVMVATVLSLCVVMAQRGLEYKGQGLAAYRPARS
jgi:hypothetical protein